MPDASEAAYQIVFLDWLACAVRGAQEPAARAARAAGDGLLELVTALGTAGHALDYDDTYLPGLAHLSAPTAPAALALGAELDADVGGVLDAYAAGFEAMGAVARASHPALYDAGWHPTAALGGVGAATAAARLLGLDGGRERSAVALSLLRAGGLRAAFGSDAKALQVGMAASAGVQSALAAAEGASVDLDRVASGEAGFEQVFGAALADPSPAGAAIERNWIKAYPCCLQTHGSIDAALAVRDSGLSETARIEVAVHPVSRQAAPLDDPLTGLEAKFSIAYLTAFTLLYGPPDTESFAEPDPQARAVAAEHVTVRTDRGLLESEAVLYVDGTEAARIEA